MNDQEAKLTVRITSFSYRKGLPVSETDHGGGFVFDLRCLPNPGREEIYKSMTGKEQPVITFLDSKLEVAQYKSHAFALVDQAIKNYLERDFKNLEVHFGCTGGQHRSVYFAGQLAKYLEENPRISLVVTHREFP